LTFATPSAFAAENEKPDRDAPPIVAKCLKQIADHVRATKRSTHNTAVKTARLVNQLQEAGRDDAAIAAARRGATRVDNTVERSLERLRTTCQRCIDKLEENGNSDGADRVRAACRQAAAVIEKAGDHAKGIIRRAVQGERGNAEES